jgi:hypothetical protein
VGRATEWLRQRPAEAWLTLAIVAGSMAFVWLQLQPHLLLRDTTAAGGDMGAHVWGPAFLRDELLPRLRLSGWAPDWYAGFPAYQFYMVVPALAVVALDAVPGVPYNVAFKLVTVSGLVFLPLCGWGMGRLARLRFPVPAALAVATVPFVFDRSFSIYGGNALSTLAGEFSFTISLCFALLFVGVLIGGLDTPGRRVSAAVLLALCVTCHLIPAVFALLAGAVVVVLDRLALPPPPAGEEAPTAAGDGPDGLDDHASPLDGSRPTDWRWTVAVVAVGALLTAFWTVPFLLRRDYLNDMGWVKLGTYLQSLFPGRIGHALTVASGGDGLATVPGDSTWVVVFALIGAGASIAFRRRFGTVLVVLAVVLALAFRLAPQGRLWNARLLPFWYLCLYLLAALAVVELFIAVATLLRPHRPGRAVTAGGIALAALLTVAAVAFPLRALPFDSTTADGLRYHWFGFSTLDRSHVPTWARWNYTGYEGKAAWPEYEALVSTMDGLGRERGCGRAMWEYDRGLDRFGTPMALMLLPSWTDGCIGSMEGLYFEASATTPYHFLNQAELSAAPSNAQRELPYGPLDVGRGVDHLQLLGVRYYVAFSAAALALADAEPELVPVAQSGRFRVYEVVGSRLVEPLAFEPAVIEDAPSGGRAWQDLAVDWYVRPEDERRVLLAADGPPGWQRVTASPGARPAVDEVAAPEVVVDHVITDEDTIAFEVDRVGTPVLVKASYFPNWRASGADGPYRVAPNLMVVVPTEREVRLEYGRTGVDLLGWLVTAVGVAGLVGLLRAGRRRHPGTEPVAVTADTVPDLAAVGPAAPPGDPGGGHAGHAGPGG